MISNKGSEAYTTYPTYFELRLGNLTYEYDFTASLYDVSGKRSPNIKDYIDNYLIENGIDEFEEHFNCIQKWKQERIIIIV